MMTAPDIGGLPEAPDTEDQQKEDLDDLVDDSQEDEDSFAKSLLDLCDELSRALDDFEVAETNMPTIENATDTLPLVANAAISDPTPDDRLGELENVAAEAVEKTKEAPDSDKKWTASQYAGLFFGVSVTLAAIGVVIEYLHRQANNQPTNDLPPLPPDTGGTIETLVDQWKSFDDAKFWTSLATYVDKNPGALTGPQQIVFMNLTIQLCPLTGYWLWDNAKDKANMAEQLVTVYGQNNDTADMYRSAATLTYNSQPVPRAVTADLLRLALSWVFHSAPSTAERAAAATGGATEGADT
jgi:hypothetical protein